MRHKTVLLIMATLMLLCSGCADSTLSMIEEARHEAELEENALELEDLPETERSPDAGESIPQPETGEGVTPIPFLDKDGGGDFDATPQELVYSLNMLLPNTPFEGEEQLRYSSYRFTNSADLLLCMRVDANTLHPDAIVIAGAACEPEIVAEVQRVSALLFRMVNENTSAQQSQAYLDAMGATSTVEADLPVEPVVKYSNTMTYEHGVFNGVYYMTVSAVPGKAISVSYETMFAAPEPEPEPEPTPERGDGSLAAADIGNMRVKVMSVKGGVTKNGNNYIGINMTVANVGAVKTSLASSCYISVTQDSMEMEELTFVSQEFNSKTAIDAGATVDMTLFYECDSYTGIQLQIKSLMGSSDEQILINF